MIESVFSFLYGWKLAGFDPPKHLMDTIHFVEPLLAIAHDGAMGGLVDVIHEGLDVLPHGHVDEGGVAEESNVGFDWFVG